MSGVLIQIAAKIVTTCRPSSVRWERVSVWHCFCMIEWSVLWFVWFVWMVLLLAWFVWMVFWFVLSYGIMIGSTFSRMFGTVRGVTTWLDRQQDRDSRDVSRVSWRRLAALFRIYLAWFVWLMLIGAVDTILIMLIFAFSLIWCTDAAQHLIMAG